MRAMIRGAIAAAVGLSIGVSTTVAHAGNEVAAEALFVEAKKLAAQGKYAEACPKFAESNRLDRGAGTLIHLGDCYEKNKQTASAWATYKEAASAAQALGRRDWEKLASQRAQTLEGKLARLTIKVDPPSYALEVVRDGEKVTRASWNVAIPVDIGTHTVDASAPGYKPYKTTATVRKDGESVEVAVPALEAEPAQAAAPKPDVQEKVSVKPPGADTASGSSQRTIGLVLGGIGVAGLAVGAVTGLMALGKSNDAKDACPNDGGCANRDAVSASDDAKTFGLVSTIGFGAGAALAIGGAVLFLTAPSAKTTSLHLSPRAGGLVLGGTFQ
jgi:hypothetical protein